MEFVIEHLEKHFEKKQVLRDVSFTFESGKIYGLLGRNGAGKTTLFNCLNRDMKADGGRFFIREEGKGERSAAGRNGICALHPGGAGISHRPGISEVFYGNQPGQHPPAKDHRRVF